MEELAAEGPAGDRRRHSGGSRCRTGTTLSCEIFEDKLTLIGLVGLIDPPRAEAIEAVAECHAAGIRVKMITGDHAATARAIAARSG